MSTNEDVEPQGFEEKAMICLMALEEGDCSKGKEVGEIDKDEKLRIQANLIWKGQANHDAYANQNEEANQREIPKEWRSHRDHPQENLPTEPAKKMVSISVVRKMMGNVAFVSQIVPSEAEDASEANLDGQAKHDGHSNPNEESD
ncbi:hypothetical protein M9H77_12387 [Catharanthus roseus]|uniref:Uncharacterized protein n=1 Tax=Catharanthus roseus TaxID=4058 RepID=A0ACC0BHF8_CATRO|nr:hypothetical protein M9H77_12387 [Catharanthus roseus]